MRQECSSPAPRFDMNDAHRNVPAKHLPCPCTRYREYTNLPRWKFGQLQISLMSEAQPPNSYSLPPSVVTARYRFFLSPQQDSAVRAEYFFTSREYRHLLTLAALLPQRVIEDLVNRRRLGKTANPHFATESIDAALLFIDISGFTASMEMFAQQGSQGIEKFWKMFNAYFCDILDIIEV